MIYGCVICVFAAVSHGIEIRQDRHHGLHGLQWSDQQVQITFMIHELSNPILGKSVDMISPIGKEFIIIFIRTLMNGRYQLFRVENISGRK